MATKPEDEDVERRRLLIETAYSALQLTPLERDLLAYLLERPPKMWCPGCDTLLRALHQRATA